MKHLSMYHDMLEYGVENFVVTCVEIVDDATLLSEREQYWREYYDTFNNGYNATLGGDGSFLYDYDEIWGIVIHK